jgi:hypothetical protein
LTSDLIGEIGYGPYFAIPNTSYLHVFQSGQLKLAVNTPNGAYSWGARRDRVRVFRGGCPGAGTPARMAPCSLPVSACAGAPNTG